MSDETSGTQGIVDGLAEIIKRHGTQEFSKAKEHFLSGPGAEEAFIGRLAESLANSLLQGILQVSVEEIPHTEAYAHALGKGTREFELDLSKDLPPLIAYVEFVFRYGLFELLTVRYEFKVDSKVDAKNLKVVIEERRIQSILFGTVVVDVTLSVLANGLKVQIGTFERQLKLNYRWKRDEDPGVISTTGITTEPPAYCRKCGRPSVPNASYCTHCGSKIE
jgi:hypothetical protein